MAVPFAVAFDAGYDGPLRLSITLGPWQHASDGDQLLALIEGLALLADRGAFVRSAVHPKDARMRLLSSAHSAPHRYVWDYDARGVDARFAQIVRNQLVMYTAVCCPVQHALLEMLQPPRPATPAALAPLDALAVAQGKVYPERFGKLRFVVEEDFAGDVASGRRAEIELVEAFDDALLATLRDWFDLWARTLDCAYSASEPRLAEGKCAIWDYDTDLVDDVTIETTLGYWGAPECAWHSYANLVARVDAELSPVHALRIY